ncbi:MAG TPA: ATP synthase F0 subunit B [Acidimicrobiales bacterium]|nr:ATP synthase F0 subunit B [Acidimicrobiales bacterium]
MSAYDDDRPAGGSTDVEAETLLRRVIDIVSTAKSMPLSASVLISKDEVLELLQDAVDRLPEELRQARRMLKEREDFLAKVQREAEEILDAARVRAERMVQRTEIVRSAQQTARRTVEEAEDEARRLRHEAEDYCDQKLGAFEVVLDRTLKTVQAGRDKLKVTPLPPPEPSRGGEAGDELPEPDESFFDQDEPF